MTFSEVMNGENGGERDRKKELLEQYIVCTSLYSGQSGHSSPYKVLHGMN